MVDMDTRATAFGRVLGRVMEARGILAEPEEIRTLAERAGFDGAAFLALATSEDGPAPRTGTLPPLRVTILRVCREYPYMLCVVKFVIRIIKSPSRGLPLLSPSG